MTQQRSNTYRELEHVLNGYPPNEPVTTHMVINGQLTADGTTVINGQIVATGTRSMTPDEVRRELADIIQGAEAFGVFVTVMHDEIENTALIALSGKAVNLGDLAAFMSTARATSAS